MPSLGDMKHKFTAWLPATDSYMQQYISALFIVRSRVQQVMSTKGGCMYHLGSTSTDECTTVMSYYLSEMKTEKTAVVLVVEPDTGNIPVSTFEKTCATTEKT